MNSIMLILVGVLAISILTAVFRTIQKGFHLKIFFPVLIAGVLVAAGLALNQEVREFQTTYPSTEKLFLLNANDHVIGGASGVLTKDGNVTFLDMNELEQKTMQWQGKNLDSLKGDHYMVFVIALGAFDQTERQVYFHGQDHNSTLLFHLLASDNATEEYASATAQQKIRDGALDKRYGDAATLQLVQNIQEQIGDNGELKGAVFTALLSEAMEEEGQLFLFHGMKRKTMIMHPKPYFMRLFLFIPDPLLEQLIITI